MSVRIVHLIYFHVFNFFIENLNLFYLNFFFVVLDILNVMISKINLKKIKNIILIYFKIKNISKNNYC
jgi:hypothetical protein